MECCLDAALRDLVDAGTRYGGGQSGDRLDGLIHHADQGSNYMTTMYTDGSAEAWAARIGPKAMTMLARIFESVAVEEQGINPALAVMRLT